MNNDFDNDNGEGVKDNPNNAKKRLADLRRSFLEQSSKTLKQTGAGLKQTGDLASKTAAQLGKTGTEYGHRAAQNIRKLPTEKRKLMFGDDPTRVKAECKLLNDLQTREIPIHVEQSIIYAALAYGVLDNATQITRVTRSFMDHDKAPLQELLREVLNSDSQRTVSGWMDRIPGSDYSGGTFHRLHHGHDAEALIQIFHGYGHEGAAEWFNHVWLRDFWTLHGIPYLPFGSGNVHEWLVSIGITPMQAAGLLSINVADVTGALLVIRSSQMISEAVQKFIKQQTAKRYWQDAVRLDDYGDHDAASEKYEAAVLHLGNQPIPLLWLAVRCLDKSREADSPLLAYRYGDRAYRLAEHAKRDSPGKMMPYLGSTEINLLGFAATIMVGSAHSAMEKSGGQLEIPKGLIPFAVDELIKTAQQQRKGMAIPGIDFSVAGARPYSALLNEVLALRLLTATPDIRTPYTPASLQRNIVKAFDELQAIDEENSEYVLSLRRGFECQFPMKV